MPLTQFLGITAAGGLVWNSALIGTGYALASRWHVVERYVGGVSNVVYVLLAIVVVVLVARRWRRRRAEHADAVSR